MVGNFCCFWTYSAPQFSFNGPSPGKLMGISSTRDSWRIIPPSCSNCFSKYSTLWNLVSYNSWLSSETGVRIAEPDCSGSSFSFFVFPIFSNSSYSESAGELGLASEGPFSLSSRISWRLSLMAVLFPFGFSKVTSPWFSFFDTWISYKASFICLFFRNL